MNTIYGEWVECKNCIYFEDCDTKEDKDGCFFGEFDNTNEEYIKKCKENG